MTAWWAVEISGPYVRVSLDADPQVVPDTAVRLSSAYANVSSSVQAVITALHEGVLYFESLCWLERFHITDMTACINGK